jgi:hypothetical protein
MRFGGLGVSGWWCRDGGVGMVVSGCVVLCWGVGLVDWLPWISHDGLSPDHSTTEMTLFIDETQVGKPRTLPLPPPPSAATVATAAPGNAAFRHRIWLPNDSGVHEVRILLSGSLDELHVSVYEKLAVGLRTHISFPPTWYTFGRAMLPFIRVGAEGYQCFGGQPLDNSTGSVPGTLEPETRTPKSPNPNPET